jgi:hypothetical protein
MTYCLDHRGGFAHPVPAKLSRRMSSHKLLVKL